MPVVSHEIGQWCVYPNFAAVARYGKVALDHHTAQVGIRLQPRRGEGLEFHQLRELREALVGASDKAGEGDFLFIGVFEHGRQYGRSSVENPQMLCHLFSFQPL